MTTYTKVFNTVQEYETYVSSTYPTPNVSYIKETDGVYFTPKEDEATTSSETTSTTSECDPYQVSDPTNPSYDPSAPCYDPSIEAELISGA